MKKLLSFFVLLLVVFSIKPLSIYAIEKYLSSLLETEVDVISFSILELDLQASIKEKTNIADVKINSLYPLQADLFFNGNANAFKVYHPLKAVSSLKGDIYYKDSLRIKAELLALGSKSILEVNEYSDDWEVSVKIYDLNLTKLQDENNVSLNASGLVNGDINFHTDKNSTIKFTSNEINVFDDNFKKVEFQIIKEKEYINAWAIFEASDIDYKGILFNYDANSSLFDGKANFVYKKNNIEMALNLNGEHNSSALSAKANLNIGGSVVKAENIIYDFKSSKVTAQVDFDIKTLEKHKRILEFLDTKLAGDFTAQANIEYQNNNIKADMQTRNFGGDLRLRLDKNRLEWKGENVELEKVLKFFAIQEKASSKIDTQGHFFKNELKSDLSTKSLYLDKEEIKDIKISVEGPIKAMKASAKLNSKYAQLQHATIDIDELNKIRVDANITTPYMSAPISLQTNVSYSKEISRIDLNASSKEFNLNIPNGTFANGRLDAVYDAIVEPNLSKLEDKLHLNGNLSYEKLFNMKAKSTDFAGETYIEVNGENIKIKATNIQIQRLLAVTNQKPYATGKFDLRANGDLKGMNFVFDSKNISLDKEETGIDENLSCEIKGKVNSDTLSFLPKIENRVVSTKNGNVNFALKDKSLNLKLPLLIKIEGNELDVLLQSDVSLSENINANIKISNKTDELNLRNLVYKEKKLTTNIEVNIIDLIEYKNITGQELYGRMLLKGQGSYENSKPYLFLSTDSLGGELNTSLKDKEIEIDAKHLSAPKIGVLLKKRATSRKGYLDGKVFYDLEKKSGYTRLSAKDVEVQGIDIDKSLQKLQDLLDLNIYAIGDTFFSKRFSKSDDMNLTTEVKHIEFDVDITPELIISKDIAMSTKYSRFAVDAELKHNGDIKEFEIAILDLQGCAIIKQKLKGNIAEPQLANVTGTAVKVLSSTPEYILKKGVKIIDAGANIVDSTASFIWQKALFQNSKINLVSDTLGRGSNVFSEGKNLIVSGKCQVFYSGEVKQPIIIEKEKDDK